MAGGDGLLAVGYYCFCVYFVWRFCYRGWGLFSGVFFVTVGTEIGGVGMLKWVSDGTYHSHADSVFRPMELGSSGGDFGFVYVADRLGNGKL